MMRKIKVDLSGWEVSDWGDKLTELVKVEVDRDSIEIKLDLDGKLYDDIARKIGSEAIEEYLFEISRLDLCADGLIIGEHDGESFTIGWERLLVQYGSAEAFKAAQTWLDEQFQEIIDEIPEDEREEFKRKSGRA